MSGKVTWPTPHHVKALANMALPATVTELQNLLDTVGFVRTFMTHYSQLSHVLERLTGCFTRREAQRTPVQWTKAAVLVFLKIKHKLIHFAYNYIIDPDAPLFINADSRRHRSRAYARNTAFAIAGRIHVEKLESDTDWLPNL